MLGLSLPVDIPWKRLAFSADMMVRAPYQGVMPRRWRSSLTIFGYEPGPEYQIYDGQTISYLKVSASITGFQPDPDEVGIKDRRNREAWKDRTIIEEYEKAAGAYYGCYGAILEIAVTPSGSAEQVAKIPLDDYPYIADFEPKKRELFELVTDTGEVMSRSIESVNVRKGMTTSENEERVDSLGYGLSVTGQKGGESASVSGTGSIQSQHSTTNVTGLEVADVRTTDAGREARETYSHTTQITQMYHQLNSYHLGSNRTVFFVLPRPHVVQSEDTFVNGPRVLEGVQEFFLVTLRPSSIKDICVDAYLETAHLSPLLKLTYEQSSGLAELHLFQPAPNPDRTVTDDTTVVKQSGATQFTPPDGWEVDLDRAGKTGNVSTPGYQLEVSTGAKDPGNSMTVHATVEHLTISGTVEGRFDDKAVNKSRDGRLDVAATVFIRRKMPTVSVEDQTLYLTGRSVSTCRSIQSPEAGYIAWEGPLKTLGGRKPGLAASLREANALRADIGATILESANHPNRYEAGRVRFVDSQVLANVVTRIVNTPKHPDIRPVNTVTGVDPAILKQIGRAASTLTTADVLRRSLADLAADYKLTTVQAASLRRAVLGLNKSTRAR